MPRPGVEVCPPIPAWPKKVSEELQPYHRSEELSVCCGEEEL